MSSRKVTSCLGTMSNGRLTSEHRFAGMSSQVGWSADEPLPSCFQCLFAVRLGPVNMDTEARPAVLLTVRSYGA